MNETTLFDFESDFVDTLRCIPMAVRFKLDHVGIKLSLRQWSRLSAEERRDLLLAPCATPPDGDAYRERLRELLSNQGEMQTAPLPPGSAVDWNALEHTPAQIDAFARAAGVKPLRDATWRGLTDLQRFVLLKLSRDNHDNVNFVPALKEFGLL